MQQIECLIYKTPAREGAYLYLRSSVSMAELPDSLQRLFADRIEVMPLTLTPTTKLASEAPAQVMANLQEQGYHLQLERSPVEDLPGLIERSTR
ncbi:MAG: YcgL domain-containing protein [Gammaproteobacteria bacterium]